MARITYVKKAQASKDERKCGKCGKDINPGDAYKWVKPNRYGGKWFRCDECPVWTRSELSSSKMAQAWEAQDEAYTQLDAISAADYIEDGVFNHEGLIADIEAILSDCASGAESTKDDYEDGLNNMPEQLQDDVGQQIQEKMDSLEQWKDSLESWDSPTWDGDDVEDDDDTSPEETSKEERLASLADQAETFTDEAVSSARDLVDELEF